MAAEGVAGRLVGKPMALGVAVAPLVALAICIQTIDRGNLATAAPLMKSDLGLSTAQVGVLISAFYWTYTPCQPLAGWLAHRLNPYRTLALGLALWSLATAASGLVSGFAALIILRLLVGMGESAAFPCGAKLLAGLPGARLGAANGLIGLGMGLGPAFGTWGGGNLMAATGWRASFLVLGALSLVWLLPWWRVTREVSRVTPAESSATVPSYWQIMRRREAWGAALGHFCANYAYYFVISWLPLYLVQARGFSIPQMAGLGGLIYLVHGGVCFTVGRLADRWMRAGASATKVRKGLLIASHLIFGTSLILGASSNATVSIACLFVAAVGFGLNTPTLLAMGQTLAGPPAGGKWMGFQNCAGNCAGIAGPLITGLVIEATGNYALAFIIAGAVAFVGLIGWAVLIRAVEPLDWSAETGTSPVALR